MKKNASELLNDLYDAIYAVATEPNTYFDLEKVEEMVDEIAVSLKVLQFLVKFGVPMLVPESEYLNNERISINVYKKHFNEREWKQVKEILCLDKD